MSGYTSFVAVDTRTEENKATDPAALRVVPIALTDGWGRSSLPRRRGSKSRFGGLPAGAQAPAAPMSGGQMPPLPIDMSASPRAKSPTTAMFSKIRSRLGGAKTKASPTPHVVAQRRQPRPMVSADPLYEVLLTQQADGRFSWSAPFDTLVLSNSTWPDQADDVAITERVLAWLETDFTDRETEWLLAANKARRWLAR